MNTKKYILAALGILILVVGVVIGATLVQKDQNIQEKAAPATVAYISPSSQDAQVGKDVSFHVKADSGNNQIIGVDLRLSFDPNIFQVTSLERGANAANLDQQISTTFDNTTGKIKFIIYTTDKTKAITGSGLDLLRVNAKSKTNAALANYTVSFDSGTAASGVSETQNIFTTLTPGSITLIASDAQGGTSAGEPNKCGGTCGSNYNCAMNYFCYQGFCRNPICKEDKDCDCVVAKTATPKPTKTAIAISTIKATVKPTQTPYVIDIATDSPTQAPTEITEDQTSDGGSFNLGNIDFKLIGLITGILFGLFLLYKGIKSASAPKNELPKIETPTTTTPVEQPMQTTGMTQQTPEVQQPTQQEAKPFDDTIQTPQ